jgi:hypothetical protein
MRREDEGLVWKFQQASEKGFVLRARVAILKICSAGAPDQQCVAGEDPIGHRETIGIIRVTGRVEDLEGNAFDLNLVAIFNTHRDDIRLCVLAHNSDAMSTIPQLGETGYVIGMQMRIHRLHEPKVKLTHQPFIPLGRLGPGHLQTGAERAPAMSAVLILTRRRCARLSVCAFAIAARSRSPRWRISLLL